MTGANSTERLVREARRDGVEKFVAGAVVHSRGRVLLVCRSGDDDHLPGLEELPSGGVDEGETIEEGRTRELVEEIGLAAHTVDDDFVGLFDYRDGKGRVTRQFTFSIPWSGGEPELSNEHSSFRWIEYDELAACTATPETKGVLEQWWASHRQPAAEDSWRTLDSRDLYSGRVTLASRRVELPGGELIDFEVDESIPFAVAVLVIEGQSVVLARQYRYPIDRWIYDLPGGAGDAGEEPAAAAARECREELGLDPTELTPLHVFYPNPGRSRMVGGKPDSTHRGGAAVALRGSSRGDRARVAGKVRCRGHGAVPLGPRRRRAAPQRRGAHPRKDRAHPVAKITEPNRARTRPAPAPHRRRGRRGRGRSPA